MSRNNSARDNSDSRSSPPQRRETASTSALSPYERTSHTATGPGGERGASLTFADFLRILGRQGTQISLLNNDDEDEDERDDEDDYITNYDVPKFAPPFPPHDKPQKVGTELLKGGEFGSVAPKIRDRRDDRNIARSLRKMLERPGPYRRENVASVREPLK